MCSGRCRSSLPPSGESRGPWRTPCEILSNRHIDKWVAAFAGMTAQRNRMLSIENLHVKLADEDREIIRGLTLSVMPGEVHAVICSNDSATSALYYVPLRDAVHILAERRVG